MGGKGSRGGGSVSKVLVTVLGVLALCLLVALATVLGCLSALDRVNDQTQQALVELLDSKINIASSDTSFSGTLHDISDELVNDPALVELGKCETVEEGAQLDAAREVIAEVARRTEETPAVRYLYFARVDYLMSADDDSDARTDAPAPVVAILDELRDSGSRSTGGFENHVGRDDEVRYQLMVRTLAQGVYYIVFFDFADLGPLVPDGFSAFQDVQAYYYDKFGEVVACSELDGLAGANTYTTLGEGDTGIVHARLDGVDYLGVYCTSRSRDIRLAVYFVDETAAWRKLSTTQATVAALAVAACLAAAALLVRRSYRPVDSLARTLELQLAEDGRASGGKADGGKADGRSGEVGGNRAGEGAPMRLRDDGAVIAEALDAYRTAVERQHGLLNEMWLYRLLCGDDPDVLGEYEDPWVAALHGRPYTVATVRSDAPEDPAPENPAPDLEAETRRHLDGAFDCRFVAMSNQVVAVVSLANASSDELVARLEALRDDNPNLLVSAFVGCPRTRVDEIGACFGEAMALSGRYLARETYGVVRLHGSQDDAREDLDADSELVKLLPRLMGKIRALDVDASLETFNEGCRLIGGAREPRAVDGLTGVAEITGAAGRGEAAGDGRLSLLTGCAALALGGMAGPDGDAPTAGDDVEKLRQARDASSARRCLAAALKRAAAVDGQPGGRSLYESLRAYVVANYRDPELTAGSLARRSAISQSQVTKLFKRYNGTTFLEFLHDLRLDEAAALLGTTTLGEREIAQAVGYSNTITMIRAFKRYRGVVPSSLRR